jgi:hypothetical protein
LLSRADSVREVQAAKENKRRYWLGWKKASDLFLKHNASTNCFVVFEAALWFTFTRIFR